MRAVFSRLTVLGMTLRSKFHAPGRTLRSIHKWRQHNEHNQCVSISTDEASKKCPVWAHHATIYVHWPFCMKRCTYCNFNKYVDKSLDHKRMATCLIREVKTLLKQSYIKNVKSIFFGGGTPSLALPETIGNIIKTVQDNTTMVPNAEITLEMNPTSFEADKLRDFSEAGVNRISLGLQALSDNELALLGRQHTVEEGLRCLDEARNVFPGRTSVDLMFGRPYQTLIGWHQELKEVLHVCDSHISLYQLTLERGTTLFKDVTQGKLTLPMADVMADMYEVAIETLEQEGFKRYEASNFAKQGAESTHNKAYWSGCQYIGVGPGAHGRFVVRSDPEFRRQARTQTLEPTPWMREVERHGHGTRRIITQSIPDVLEEVLVLGLRTATGIPQERWSMMGGKQTLVDIFANDSVVQELVSVGHLTLDQGGLTPTRSGMSVADSITPHLIQTFRRHDTKDDIKRAMQYSIAQQTNVNEA